jgi:hypothetical protein
MWHKIWIRNIEKTSMMLKKITKIEAKEEPPRIKPLTSCFIPSEHDLHFFTRKFQIKQHKQLKKLHNA